MRLERTTLQARFASDSLNFDALQPHVVCGA